MKIKNYNSCCIAIFVTALFHLLIYPYFYSKDLGNVYYYIISFGVFFAVFFITRFFLQYFGNDDKSHFPFYVWLSFIIFVFWTVLMYFCETDFYYFFIENSLRHRISYWVYFGALFSFACFIYIIISYFKTNIKVLKVIFIFVLSGAQSLALFAPNIINDLGGNLYHIHAYFNPIYNIIEGIPFSDIINSIYGHYPIFYYLPMKFFLLIGFSFVDSAIAVTMLFGFVSFLLVYFSLYILIKRDGLFYLSALVVSYISFYYYLPGQYYQILPHRILFPSVIIFLISFYLKKRISFWVVVISSGLALLWNFESGIVCLMVMVLFYICKNIENYKKSIIYLIFKGVILGLISFVLSFVFYNIINLLLGGKIQNINGFIFPIMSDFDISDLSIRIPTIFSIYFLEFVFFSLLICLFVLKCFKRELNDLYIALSCFALLGLGLFPYFYNRAAFANVSIVHIPFSVSIFFTLQCIIETDYKTPELNILKKECVLCSSIIISFFVLGSLSGIPLTFMNRANSSWRIEEYKIVCNTIKNKIPIDAAAVGPGVTDIYYSIGREPQIYVMDWSDWAFSKNSREYTLEEINSKQKILLCDSSAISIYLDRDEWMTADCLFDVFYYLVRTDSNHESKKDFIIDYSINNNYSIEDFIDLCFLNCYDSFSDEERMKYYLDVYSNVQDRKVLYDIILNDYSTNKFGFY